MDKENEDTALLIQQGQLPSPSIQLEGSDSMLKRPAKTYQTRRKRLSKIFPEYALPSDKATDDDDDENASTRKRKYTRYLSFK